MLLCQLIPPVGGKVALETSCPSTSDTTKVDRCSLGWAIPPAGGKLHGCRCGQRRKRHPLRPLNKLSKDVGSDDGGRVFAGLLCRSRQHDCAAWMAPFLNQYVTMMGELRFRVHLIHNHSSSNIPDAAMDLIASIATSYGTASSKIRAVIFS